MTPLPDHHAAHGSGHPYPPRALWRSLWRGWRHRCPSCGWGRLFLRYLKVAPACGRCGEELHHHRADDAPAYFTVLIVGHMIIPLALWMEMSQRPPMWVHAVLWAPITLTLALTLLPAIKGALVALQWALYMHGFDPDFEQDPDTPF